MRKLNYLAVIAAILILTGCVPVNSSPSLPYSASGVSAVGTLEAAQFQATLAAEHASSVQRTAEAQQYNQLVQLTAQQAGFDRQQTATIVAQQAVMTQAVATQQAQATATAWIITQTPMAATQQAVMLAAEKAANRARWERVTEPMKEIAPTAMLVLLGILLLVGLVLIWPKAMRLMNVLERRASTIISPDGQIITYIPTDDPIHVVSPQMSFYPVMQLGEGGAEGYAAAPDPALQNAHNSRAQTVALAHAIKEKGETGRRMLKAAMQPGSQEPASVVVANPNLNIEIIEPDQLKGWLGEVEQKLLSESSEEVL